MEDVQLIYNKLDVQGLVINESFQVAIVIEKLPQFWKNLKNYLKHKQKVTSLEILLRG